ncbi:MAG: protoporphyrinogen oxidase [Candidatus Sumerlaeia bacterium]
MITRQIDVLICGGGISGLSLGAWLARGGADVVVLDKNARPGGVIGTIHQDGFVFERGPNTILDKHASFNELIEWAGLEPEIIRAPLSRQKRWVWLKGALRLVPTGPVAFMASPLLPLRDKLALLAEPFVKCNPDDETVADFVRRRLGSGWLRNLITPMVSGVWAGDPEKISTQYSFPVMKEMERDGGSLIVGAAKRMRRKRKTIPPEGGTTNRVKSLVSFRDGLDRLPAALAAKLGDRYHGSTRIERIEDGGDGGFRVVASGQAWRARHLVVAAEADQASEWLEPLDSNVSAVLRHFPYNRLVAMGLGIDAGEARVPEGFGFLVPRGEGVRILGAIVNSNFLPGRAPQGCATMTIFIGGDLDPAAADLADDELIGLVKRDLRTAIGWRGEPRSVFIERWPRAIPQYRMDHGERLRQIEAAEARRPGLHLVGNWRGGVAIADRIEYTHGLSRELLGRLPHITETVEK